MHLDRAPAPAAPLYCVLVVDDDPGVRDVALKALARRGVAAVGAASGGAAVDLYRLAGADFGLVLLDVAMPGLDGPATLAALRAIDPGVRCVFMSGYARGYGPAGLAALGPAGFLAKPFTPARLAAALAAAVGPAPLAPAA